MKKYIFKTITIIFFLFVHLTSFANSYPKVSKNGQEYYQYEVQKSEGLYAIARKFNVKIEDILKHNPDTRDGLQAGQVIYILIVDAEENKQVKENVEHKKEIQPSTQTYPRVSRNGQAFYEYEVEKSEGLYAVARKFSVKMEDVLKHNPETRDGLQLGQVIYVPIEEEKPEHLKEHIVRKKETVYSLSKIHQVSLDSIYKYNPHAKNGLKEGELIYLPLPIKNSLSEKQTKQEKEIVFPTIVENQEEKNILHVVQKGETLYSLSKKYHLSRGELLILNPIYNTKPLSVGDTLRLKREEKFLEIKEKPILNKELNVAFLLPFMSKSESLDPVAEKFIDFYQGALLAIDSLKKEGYSFKIYAYDTDRTEEKMNTILRNPSLKTMDLIIGPAYTIHVKSVSEFSMKNKIRLVVPFSSKTEEVFSNPYLYQCNAHAKVIDEQVSMKIIELFSDKNIVLVNFKETEKSSLKALSTELEANFKKDSIQYASLLYKDNIEEVETLLKEKDNVLLLMTNNPATLAKMAPDLEQLEQDFVLFGQPEWLDVAIAQTDISNHIIYTYSPFHIAYESKEVSRFYQKFGENFGYETSKSIPHFHLLGYDIALYFLKGLSVYREEFEENMHLLEVENLQTQFTFQKISPEGGYVNEFIYLFKYENHQEEIVVKKAENEEN